MKDNEHFSWEKRARSFKYACKGLKSLVSYEHNARIHLVAAVIAVGLGFLLNISAVEWCIIVMCIAAVISAEAVNSAVEALADRITSQRDPFIGRAKDLGAAAVFLVAIASLIVGLVIFVPKILAIII